MQPDIDAAHRRLVAAMAGPDALPAGGAAAVATVGMGLALGHKVLRLSSGDDGSFAAPLAALEALRERLMPEFDADCAAFDQLLRALRLPRTDPSRASAVDDGWLLATAAPVRVAHLARSGDELLAQCVGKVRRPLAGDLAAALELVRAGLRIALANARENAEHLEPAERERLLADAPVDATGC